MITKKPGILRLAVTILPFYLLTGALATNTRAEIIWGNMTYFAPMPPPGASAKAKKEYEDLIKGSKKWTGTYAFDVEPIKTTKGVELKVTDISGPDPAQIGDYTYIPATLAESDYYTFDATKVQEYGPPPKGGMFPRKIGKNNISGTYYPGFLSFELTRVGSLYPGTYWTFMSTTCVGMPEPPTEILLVIGSAGTIAYYGWRRRRAQRRQRPVGPPEAF